MDINNSVSGKVVKSITGYNYFVPNPLPPKITWTNALVTNLSRANYIFGMLAREGNNISNPYVLMRPFVTREAVLSSKIEGTQATLGEILAEEVGAHVDRNSGELKEVKNYISALEYGLELLGDLPLCMRLIRKVHAKLMDGARGSHTTPGEIRKTQNWIGTPGCMLNAAKYIPPAPEVLSECLDEFEKFLHDRTLPLLVHIALCHYQFEAIHPFLDGNGRIGRLLISLLLVERKVLSSPILYLSAFFEATRDEYYKQLYNVSSSGSWQEWLLYFLNGVATQSQDILSRIERMNALIVEWEESIRSNHSVVLREIIKYFSINPYLTIKKIAQKLNIAFTTAQRAIEKLENLGIVSQTSPGLRDRVYCATKILAILEEPAVIRNITI